MQFILSLGLFIFLLALSLWLGYFVIQLLLPPSKINRTLIFYLSLIIGLLIPNLVMAQLNYFLKIPITQTNLLAIWTIICLVVFLWRKLARVKNHFPKIGLNWVALTGFAAILPTYFQWQKYVIGGGDAPIYFYRLAYTINSGNLFEYLDRGTFYVIPLSFHWLTGLGLQNSIRLTHVLVFSLSALSVALLCYSLTKIKWLSIWVFLKTILSASHNSFSLDFFVANRMGITITTFCLILMIVIASKKEVDNKSLILLVFLWLSLFGIHGLIAFSSIIVIGLPFILLLIKFVLDKRLFNRQIIITIIASLMIAFITTQPLINRYFNKLASEVMTLVSQDTQLTMPGEKISSTQELPTNNQPNQTFNPTEPTWFVNLDRFAAYYSQITLFLAFIGLLTAIYYIRWHQDKRFPYLMFLASATGLFVISQQIYFGTSWLSDRFIRGQYPYLIPLAALGLLSLDRLVRTHKIMLVKQAAKIIAAVILLSVARPWYSSISQSYRPSISPESFWFYREISDYIPKNVPLYDTSSVLTWGLGFNRQHQVIPISQDQLCSLSEEVLKTNPDYAHYLAFSSYLNKNESVDILTNLNPNTKYAIILDTNNNCLNQNLFTVEDYSWLIQTSQFKLLIKK